MKNIVRDDFICQCTQRKLNFLYHFFRVFELLPYLSPLTFLEIGEFIQRTAAPEQAGGSLPCSRGTWMGPMGSSDKAKSDLESLIRSDLRLFSSGIQLQLTVRFVG